MNQKLSNLKKSSVYDYDTLTDGILKLVRKDLSAENASLIEKYDRTMVSLSMARATRLLHLRTLRSLSRILGKNWNDVTKSDIDELVYKIMQRYASREGQETNTSSDHKKILKIFFRWYNFWAHFVRKICYFRLVIDITKDITTKKLVQADLF